MHTMYGKVKENRKWFVQNRVSIKGDPVPEDLKNEIGNKALKWFKNNNGQKLANEWISLIDRSNKE